MGDDAMLTTMRWISTSVVILAMAGQGPARTAQAKPLVLEPITPWNVDWSETRCSLRRGFGDKAKPDFLLFDQFEPSTAFQLTLINAKFRNFKTGMPIWLRYGVGEPFKKENVMPAMDAARTTFSIIVTSTTLADPLPDGTPSGSVPVTQEMEARVTSVAAKAGIHEVVFHTGPLDKPMAALRSCTEDLVRSWGLDPATQAALARPAEPLLPPSDWLSDSDYPAAMTVVGKQAIVNFRLSVDAQGNATGCQVQRSYNEKLFDELTCQKLLLRARFKPALDASGQPTATYYTNTVLWIMGDPEACSANASTRAGVGRSAAHSGSRC